MIILLCMLSCTSAHCRERAGKKAAISADIASVITSRNIRLDFSHSFSATWSAHGSVSLQPPLHSPEETETGHEYFPGKGDHNEDETAEQLYPEFRIGTKYWIRKFMEGPYMDISCVHGIRSGTDLSVGCGYAARIWKSIGICAGYELRLLNKTGHGEYRPEGITITVNYLF